MGRFKLFSCLGVYPCSLHEPEMLNVAPAVNQAKFGTLSPVPEMNSINQIWGNMKATKMISTALSLQVTVKNQI